MTAKKTRNEEKKRFPQCPFRFYQRHFAEPLVISNLHMSQTKSAHAGCKVQHLRTWWCHAALFLAGRLGRASRPLFTMDVLHRSQFPVGTCAIRVLQNVSSTRESGQERSGTTYGSTPPCQLTRPLGYRVATTKSRMRDEFCTSLLYVQFFSRA